VEIKPGQAKGFIDRPDSSIQVILLFGNDEGLIREWGTRLTRQVIEDPDDPFRFVELDGPALSSDASTLYDEASAMAFGGGQRVVRIRRLSGRINESVIDFLGAPVGDARVIMEAPGANKKSAIVKAAIKSPVAAAIPCYHDESRALRELVTDALGAAGLRADQATSEFIATHAGSDRALTRREIDKLALYMGAGNASPAGDSESSTTVDVSLADAQAVIGDTALLTMDSLIDAVFDGRLPDVERNFRRVQLEGVAPGSVLRAMANHMANLVRYRGYLDAGLRKADANRKLRPPVNFTRIDGFDRQARLSPRAMAAIMDRIAEAERLTRQTGMPDTTTCARALAGIAATVNRR